MLPAPRLARFSLKRPAFELPQAQILAWLADAHIEAQTAVAQLGPEEREAFATHIRGLIRHCACGPDRIARRGMSIPDLTTTRWDEAAIYDLPRHPHGRGAAVRTERFAAIVAAYFADEYAAERAAPDDLIHVTCTGYVSPSGAQRLVSARGWGAHTRVTHAYHMGCYAAVPAVRLAVGCGVPRVDLVHTEVCSLHFDPTRHTAEQVVVNSLFGDGFIRYSLLADDHAPGLRLLALHEQLLPDSADLMTWSASDWGMQMALSAAVPDRIAAALRDFVAEVFRRGGRTLGDARSSVFAVHPGGPRILDRVAAILELDPPQLAASRAVLFAYGNMSSATLPHIWMRLCDDPDVAPGTLILSLAFGPGLTVCGGLFEKR